MSYDEISNPFAMEDVPEEEEEEEGGEKREEAETPNEDEI